MGMIFQTDLFPEPRRPLCCCSRSSLVGRPLGRGLTLGCQALGTPVSLFVLRQWKEKQISDFPPSWNC